MSAKGTSKMEAPWRARELDGDVYGYDGEKDGTRIMRDPVAGKIAIKSKWQTLHRRLVLSN